MAATIDDVRLLIDDTSEPYRKSDSVIEDMLEVVRETIADQWSISLETARGRRAQTLLAGAALNRDDGYAMRAGGIKSVKDGDNTITYSERGINKEDRWTAEAETILLMAEEAIATSDDAW